MLLRPITLTVGAALIAAAATALGGPSPQAGFLAPRNLAAPTQPPPPGPPVPGDTPVLDAALELARADHPKLDEAAVRKRIAALADTWRGLLPDEPSATQRADTFARLLFEVEGFTSVADLDSPETLHIDSVLAHRKGYCLSLTVVALSVAEALGEPLHAVAMPNHVLVRWDDGELRRNLELTRRGAIVSDEALVARLGDFYRDDLLYTRNLSPSQVRALLLHNRGHVASVEGRDARALSDLRAAVRLIPELPEAHRNLGVVLGEAGDYAGAVTAFDAALTIYPGDVDALLNLALARRALGETARAADDLRTVLALQPDHARAAALLAQWGGSSPGAAAHRPLAAPPSDLAPGLMGTYFAGRRFDRAVARAVARDLDFDWKRGSPLRGVPSDRFSVRWEGWFKAPEDGLYTLFVVANDGVRVSFGEEAAVDHWQDTGYTSWTGTGEAWLHAGWHPMRVEHYDDSDNARLFVIISRDGDEYPLPLAEHLFHQPD